MERAIALKRGAEHERVKAQTEPGRYKAERERWGPRLREFKQGSVIKREGRLDVNYRRESVHKKNAGEGGLE